MTPLPSYTLAWSAEGEEIRTLLHQDPTECEAVGDTAEAARRMCAAQSRVPIANVVHVVDDAGAPICRTFVDPPNAGMSRTPWLNDRSRDRR